MTAVPGPPPVGGPGMAAFSSRPLPCQAATVSLAV